MKKEKGPSNCLVIEEKVSYVIDNVSDIGIERVSQL